MNSNSYFGNDDTVSQKVFTVMTMIMIKIKMAIKMKKTMIMKMMIITRVNYKS